MSTRPIRAQKIVILQSEHFNIKKGNVLKRRHWF